MADEFGPPPAVKPVGPTEPIEPEPEGVELDLPVEKPVEAGA